MTRATEVQGQASSDQEATKVQVVDGQTIEVQVQAVDGQAMEVRAQAVEDQAECQCPDVDFDPSRHGGETWMVPERSDLPDDRYDGPYAYLR